MVIFYGQKMNTCTSQSRKKLLEIGHIGYQKNWELYDFKIANLPLFQNAPKKVIIKKPKKMRLSLILTQFELFLWAFCP